jgi:putative nucleotidyltransferase with HDIG domain
MNNLAAALATVAGPRAAEATRGLAPMFEALDAKGGYSNEHVVAVRSTSMVIARKLRLGRTERAALAAAALLHDVGKLTVPDSILAKPGPLDEEEWAVMRSHSAAGERLLAPFVSDERIMAIVRSHHERWDGNGYPDGLAGLAIPLGARIVAVADAFQAMMEARPYRPALPRALALETIRSEGGHQFDPECVAALGAGRASTHAGASPSVTPAF